LMNAFRDSIALGLLNRSWQLEWCTLNVTCESFVLLTTMLCTWTIYAEIKCNGEQHATRMPLHGYQLMNQIMH
jgi:hypothetical protein